MKKGIQTILFLLLFMSLPFTSNTAFSQDDQEDFEIPEGMYYADVFRIIVNSRLNGNSDVAALRSLRDSYRQNLDDLETGYRNNDDGERAPDSFYDYRDATMGYLDARLKRAEEHARQADIDHFRNVMFVISAVLTDGADSVDENAPAEPNPAIANFLPIHQAQTNQTATDQLYGSVASRIPGGSSAIASMPSINIFNVDAGLYPSSAPSITSQDDAPTPEPAPPALVPTLSSASNNGGSAITVLKPLQFANSGLFAATVVVASYTPAEGVTASMSRASTVVFQGSNPSANLSLPLGTYTFCYYWDLGTDADNDGYVDYAHRSTGSVTLSATSADNTSSAQVVTLNPETMDINGKCGESAPPPVGNTDSLTPQELANQEAHTYLYSCICDDSSSSGCEFIEGEATPEVFTFNFVEGGVNAMDPENKVSFFQKIGVNTYDFSNEYIYEKITFTDTGFTLRITGGDDGANCIGLRQ